MKAQPRYNIFNAMNDIVSFGNRGGFECMYSTVFCRYREEWRIIFIVGVDGGVNGVYTEETDGCSFGVNAGNVRPAQFWFHES
mmetsp:Transcript_11722/g.17106  ORF Transcript_11722/g.17106 Transcript_11722/m.17106 type:complete len:83 (-) Transcript_11722:278-526(-)